MNPDLVRGGCGSCGPASLSVKEHLKEVLLALLEGRLSESEKKALRALLALS